MALPASRKPVPTIVEARSSRLVVGVRLVSLLILLYGFLVSIGLLGKSFKMIGGGAVDGIILSAANPFVGLFVGILATTIVQSSSTTTSIVVALVGSGAMPIPTAIPVVMGANIGTSVTNTLVSLAHISRGGEYNRAVAASTIHDFFNIFAVVILFPLQLATNFLGWSAFQLAQLFNDSGGIRLSSPLKMLTAPAVDALASLIYPHGWMLLVVSLLLMFGSLRFLVSTLKSLVITRIEALFDVVIFKTALRAFAFGLLLTALVQSSSITTSLVVPLAGAGLLRLRQIFPYTLGANVGTTVTALLAALGVGEVSAVTVAFAHLLFNLSGIAVIYGIPTLRRLPVEAAERMARLSQQSRWLPVVYIATVFYLVPLIAIVVLR
jgi:sodium-dependent phosphate cotransporter